MFCPKCGISIGAVGNFCGKCGKNVMYLREIDAAAMEAAALDAFADNLPAEGEAAIEPAPEGEPAEVKPAKTIPAKEPVKTGEASGRVILGFYCNFCGTAVHVEDNYCYRCDKKLQKKYYPANGKKRKVKMGAIFLIIFLSALVVSFYFFGGGHLK